MQLFLLLIALSVVVVFIREDRAEMARFKALTSTDERQRRFRVWAAKSFAAFAGMAVGGLAITHRLGAIVRLPAEFDALASKISIDADVDSDPLTLPPMLLGAIAGGAVVCGVAVALAMRRRSRSGPVTLGDWSALIPRNRAEVVHGALLAINAGISEELFFRLLLPLLLVAITGNAIVAFVVAAIVFGLAHLYQGAVGVVATTMLGALLTGVYLAERSLVVAMALHALIDLNALVLRPLLAGAGRTRA